MGKTKHLVFLLLVALVLSACGNKEYIITFESGTDELIEEIVVNSGSVIDELPIPELVGHDFDGWFLDEDFEVEYTDQKITKDTTLYAKWTVQTFTVTFKDGETVIATETVEYGKDVTAPTTPVKTGYKFSNWDQPLTNITSDLVINAVYEQLTYEVIFRVDGQNIGDKQIIKHGAAAKAPESPQKEGHTFKGWDKSFDNVTSDLIINAIWEAETFTVTFFDDEDNLIEKVTVEYGKDAIAPTPPTREGFEFVKWDKDVTNIKADVTVKAIYQVLKFEVKFFVNGVQVDNTQVIEYGKDAIAPADPVAIGKEFIKWDKEFTNVKTNLDIHAEFTLLTFEISYYHGDEKLVHTPASYTIEDVIIIPEYNLTGYIFLGWFLDKEFTSEPVTELDPSELKSFVLYGKFLDEDTVYNLDYELNGGTWTWNQEPVTDASTGINPYSNLPAMFTLDFFTYLRDNDLLTSPIVDASIHQTTWAGFSGQNPLHNGDPYAVYNDTTSNTGQTNNGYSQLFFDTATGDATTGELLDVQGGFLGTEPYKSKYLPLLKHIALICHYHYSTDYQNTRIWNGATGKTLLGFVLDGYFFGTQSATRGGDEYKTLRATIPNTNAEYRFINSVLTKIDIVYNFDTYTPLVDGLSITLPMPMKDGYYFIGWYDNPSCEGEKVTTLTAGTQTPTKLYAQWQTIE